MKIYPFITFVLLTFGFFVSSCSNREKKLENYRQIGTEIAQETQKSLATNLMKNMKSGGVEAAIPFCNTMANPLTSEMEIKHTAKIKRVSSKNRNVSNAPSEHELEIIQKYEEMMNAGDHLEPIIEIKPKNEVQFYAPIITQKQCLKCHGTIEADLTKKTDSLIKSFYPEDKAVGYKEGELRGIWSITYKQ